MSRAFRIILFLFVTSVVLYFFFRQPTKPSPQAVTPPQALTSEKTEVSSAATANPQAVAPSATDVPPASLAVAQPAPLSATPEYTNLSPETVLENARAAVQLYGHMFGGNPVGTNPEITSELNGNNPKQVKFLQPEAGMRINANGELIDPWGTPFFFHQLSGSVTEIRSAGPDRKMWTSDDLVAR